jgi:hypothetical protein
MLIKAAVQLSLTGLDMAAESLNFSPAGRRFRAGGCANAAQQYAAREEPQNINPGISGHGSSSHRSGGAGSATLDESNDSIA